MSAWFLYLSTFVNTLSESMTTSREHESVIFIPMRDEENPVICIGVSPGGKGHSIKKIMFLNFSSD